MVIIYTTTHCPYCKMAKEYMDKIGIEYHEENVENDKDALSEMVRKSGQMGVPVIDIYGDIIVGFDRETIDELVSKK